MAIVSLSFIDTYVTRFIFEENCIILENAKVYKKVTVQ